MKLQYIFQKSLGIKSNESILIITDKNKLRIAKRFFSACKKLSKNVKLLIKPLGHYSGEEPPKHVAEEMKKYDVIIIATKHSLTHTNARREACKVGARIASMPGITNVMLNTGLLAEPKKLDINGNKIEHVLKKTNKIKIKTPSGTFIGFSVRNRKIHNDNGILNKRGVYGNLPAGELCLSPIEKTSNGIIVVNSMEDYARNGTVIIVRNGNVIDISDKKSRLSKIFQTVENSRNIAEFGIGTNYKAKIIKNILQDEKVAGTCHIAFGNNKSYGGKVYSKVHLDAILFKPEIWFDDKIIMRNGKLLV